jgi:uncharacterized protein with HEPN domain
MSKRDLGLYLEDINTSINKIRKYTRGMNYSEFKKDHKTVDAVIRNLEIIGEAAGKLPSEFKKKHPQVPWRKMIGLRNRVAHEYFGIDIEILWTTIHYDLPYLKKEVKKLI